MDGVELFGASFRRFTYARHSHDCLAFGSVERGAMRFWHGGTEYLASKGEMITLNPGEIHDGRTDPGGCRYHMLYVQQSALEEIFAAAEPRLRTGAALKGPLLRDATLARVVGRFATQTSDSLEQQTGLAGILFQLFARHGMPPLAVRPVAHERKCVERAKDYMVQCLDRPILVGDIARAAGLSSFYFLRTFKAAAGMPPHAYLNQIRLARARQLLRAGEPPAAVAAATGFVDQSHLNRRFKSTFGVTPSQYRKTS